MKHQLLALALAAGCILQTQAIEPGKSQKLTSPDQVPEGLSATDWSSIRSAKAAGVINQEAYVKASNPEVAGNFGRSVAVSGDTVVVAAYVEDSPTIGMSGSSNRQAMNSGTSTFSGAAYVFVRSGGTWSQQAYLKVDTASVGSDFHTSVAISGDTVIVEATRGAYVFVRSGGSWSQQAYLKTRDASGLGLGDVSGPVAISGDTVVVGGVGAAYVFVRRSGSWSKQARLKGSNTPTVDVLNNDLFGGSVAVSGDTIIVGAILESSSTTGVNSRPNEDAIWSGAAYVFVRSGSTWSQQAYLKASNTGAYDIFGSSVAVSGNTVVVGAQYEGSSTRGVNSVPNEAGFSSGAAYVFTRSNGDWSQQAYLKASNTGADDFFGTSVAISGNTIVVGAYGEDSSTTGVNGNQTNNRAVDSGSAYVFKRSGETWSQQAYLKASNAQAGDYFGNNVAVSGGTIISGAYLEGSIASITTGPDKYWNPDYSGAAYIFTLPAVVKYQVSVKVNEAEFGKVTGIGSYAKGGRVTLKATPKKGRTFVGWFEKKKLITKKKVLVIKNLTADRSLVAKFK